MNFLTALLGGIGIAKFFLDQFAKITMSQILPQLLKIVEEQWIDQLGAFHAKGVDPSRSKRGDFE